MKGLKEDCGFLFLFSNYQCDIDKAGRRVYSLLVGSAAQEEAVPGQVIHWDAPGRTAGGGHHD